MCFNFSFKERDAPSLKTLDSRGTLILSSSMEYTSHGVLGMLSHVTVSGFVVGGIVAQWE